MRYRTWVLLSFFVIASCTKLLVIPSDNGCVQRVIVPATAHAINISDAVVVDSLLTANGIQIRNLRYTRYKHDSFAILNPPYTKFDTKIIMAEQYTNGLKIIAKGMTIEFRNNQLAGVVGTFSKGTSLDTIPHLTPAQVRYLFLQDLENFDHKGDQYNDSCFKVEFGYLDLNGGHSYAPEFLTKAWLITPLHSSLPLGIYRDANGARQTYNNGNVIN